MARQGLRITKRLLSFLIFQMKLSSLKRNGVFKVKYANECVPQEIAVVLTS